MGIGGILNRNIFCSVLAAAAVMSMVINIPLLGFRKMKPRAFLIAGILAVWPCVRAQVAPAAGPTVVPVVGVWLVPAGEVFKSWLDYRHSVRMESDAPGGADKFHGVKISSMETIIRRADTQQTVARIPFQGAIGSELMDERPGHVEFTADYATYDARATALPDGEAKRMDQGPPGSYLLAIYVNGVRASNVVKIRLDPGFDVVKAPTLQWGGLESNPRAPFGRVLLWAIGPTPADPDLTNFRLNFCPILVDGTVRQPPGLGGSGPRPRALLSGQRFAVLFGTNSGHNGYTPDFDGSQLHTYAMAYTPADQPQPGGPGNPSSQPRHYTAAPFSFDPKPHPLGDAWDRASPPGESRPVAPPVSVAIPASAPPGHS